MPRESKVSFIVDTNIIIYDVLEGITPFSRTLGFFFKEAKDHGYTLCITQQILDEVKSILKDILNYSVEVYRDLREYLRKCSSKHHKSHALPLIDSFFKEKHNALSKQKGELSETAFERKRNQLRFLEENIVISIYGANAFTVKDAIRVVENLMRTLMDDYANIYAMCIHRIVKK